MHNRVFESLILGLWLLVAVVVHVRKDLAYRGSLLIAKSLDVAEEEVKVKRLALLDGNVFDLTLEQPTLKNILVTPDCTIMPGCEAELKKLFRKIRNPKVVLVHKQDNGVWLVKMSFVLEGQKVYLEDWLASNNLVKK